jgi:hypothetical protein
LENGYSLVPYKNHTGIESVMFIRGPFTLVRVERPTGNFWPAQAGSGTYLQIVDPASHLVFRTFRTPVPGNRETSLAIADSFIQNTFISSRIVYSSYCHYERPW